jgi:uncharacterized membrane protein YccC
MTWLWPLFARLGSRTLATLCAVLFVVDLLIPDPVPFVDELLLGLATILLTRRGARGV